MNSATLFRAVFRTQSWLYRKYMSLNKPAADFLGISTQQEEALSDVSCILQLMLAQG